MLERIDFNEQETNAILKYYTTLVFMFQDCLKEAINNISDDYIDYRDPIKDLIGKIEEIEFLDEIEIISDKFDSFVERFKYRILNDYITNGTKVDYFNNFYLLVQANAIKNILIFALDQSWKNKENKKEIIQLGDFISILKNYIISTANDIYIQNERDNFFYGDTLYYIKLLSNPKSELDDIILLSDKIIESCDGDDSNSNYNVVDDLINDINNSMHTLYQEYINKILAINIYALCINELLKTMN